MWPKGIECLAAISVKDVVIAAAEKRKKEEYSYVNGQ